LPCHITPSRLSFWEDVEVKHQIDVLVLQGKMKLNMLKYVYKVTLLEEGW
jgi:hypothetical protein